MKERWYFKAEWDFVFFFGWLLVWWVGILSEHQGTTLIGAMLGLVYFVYNCLRIADRRRARAAGR